MPDYSEELQKSNFLEEFNWFSILGYMRSADC